MASSDRSARQIHDAILGAEASVILSAMPDTMIRDHFTPADRTALTLLGADMRYMRLAVDELKAGLSDTGAIQRRIGACEADIETLKQFRYTLLGISLSGMFCFQLILEFFVKPLLLKAHQ